MKTMIRLFKDEAGATAIEYGLIAALISVAAIAAMEGLGTGLTTTFESVTDSLPGGGGGR
jgi:pilus assembly protein Flp/PilA